ncbi:MAG: transketolase [Bacteroidales bacterium]|jgi:transketolase|nr:transketolase [Bacteroidales bacterium]MDD3700242.1 transketolase [Bacteroidales bacterium]MDY0368472.1 transketolase [Bacteroidales bacterium]
MTKTEELTRMASQVRRDIVRMVHANQSGHPGGSLGCADLLVALYFDHLRINSASFSMDGHQEDLFFLSNGHISPLFYSVLARKGFFHLSELATFRVIHSRLQGHPTTRDGLPGVRVSSGSLGQGLSVAIGAALSKKLNKDPYLVYVLMGDGEQQEGQVWEAAMYAGSKKTDNLIAIIDYNGQQIDGPVDQVMPLGNLEAKYKAFGWSVIPFNGNDMEEILRTLEAARQQAFKGQPQLLLMHTEMGYGVDFMTGTHHWHGIAPNDEQLARALDQLEETLGDY